MQQFRLINMDPFVESIVNRSVGQRMGETFRPQE
jgi:hypothetical protein